MNWFKRLQEQSAPPVTRVAPHEHDWHIVNCQPGPRQPLQAATTILLYRCSCGKVESDIINGSWSMPEIMDEQPAGEEQERG